MINNDIKEKITNVENSLKNEISTIINLKNSTQNNKNYLMNALEKLSNNFTSDNIIEESHMLPQFFKTLNDALSKANSNLLILKDLENTINSILFSISIQCSNNNINIDDLKRQLNLYNLKKFESKNNILNNSTYVERFITSTKTVINDLIENQEYSKENIIKQFKENKQNTINQCNTDNTGKIVPTSNNNYKSTENENEILYNNIETTTNISNNKEENILYTPYKINENDTLLISEKQEKIFLPYTLKDLSNFTATSEKSIEDIIRENFIIPINKFKNPTISRFKETYNLAKNKSNYSTLKSFNFAVEVMFKYSLNPAIIVACKNADELKDYLNCLKEQKLDLFKPFKIKYEINPMKI